MIFYEGARLRHGRAYPLQGDYYAAIFVHYRPIDCMRYLLYTNYQSGHSGLSNGIMSIEIGAVLALLTNRFLVLDGNVSPPANVVSYGDRVDNNHPSRVTDLIDIPVAWSEPDQVELAQLRSRELSDVHLGQAAFYVPGTVDPRSADAESFANGRTHWLSANGPLEEIPVLRVTEDNDRENPRYNLSYYSYFFYLDDETRRSVYRMLQRMQAKRELAELAQRVAADLGSFNAVHLRRGDFKVTYGVTTLDRQPWEAIEVLDHHFKRQDTLVIVTDERDDPFFDEIKAAYPHHVFIDHHVLDEYGKDFDALPHRDSVALAYLSQLIAAESKDFIGTMTSTFTAIIQRYRGNRGKAGAVQVPLERASRAGGSRRTGTASGERVHPARSRHHGRRIDRPVFVEPLQSAHRRQLDA